MGTEARFPWTGNGEDCKVFYDYVNIPSNATTKDWENLNIPDPANMANLDVYTVLSLNDTDEAEEGKRRYKKSKRLMLSLVRQDRGISW